MRQAPQTDFRESAAGPARKKKKSKKKKADEKKVNKPKTGEGESERI
jgi:hypothetical protein